MEILPRNRFEWICIAFLALGLISRRDELNLSRYISVVSDIIPGTIASGIDFEGDLNDPNCWANPLRNVSWYYGPRNFGYFDPAMYPFYTDNKHPGADLFTQPGTPIYPGYICGKSEVTWVQDDPSYGTGYAVELETTDSHDNTLYTHYYHGSSVPLVSVGGIVDKNTQILSVGQTGAGSGYNLHYEVRVRGEDEIAKYRDKCKTFQISGTITPENGDCFLNPTQFIR